MYELPMGAPSFKERGPTAVRTAAHTHTHSRIIIKEAAAYSSIVVGEEMRGQNRRGVDSKMRLQYYTQPAVSPFYLQCYRSTILFIEYVFISK